MLAVATAALLSLGLVQAQNTTSSLKSVILDSKAPYILSYSILNENSTNPTFAATLNLQNFLNTSWWKPDGQSGLYLALGYNALAMPNADVSFCVFMYYGRANDSFVCSDIKYDPDRTALFDERNDIKNVKTVANKTTGQFSVSFERSFLSNETQRDSNLTLGVTPVIWSFGDVVKAWPVQHGNSNFGTVRFNMQTGEKLETSLAYAL